MNITVPTTWKDVTLRQHQKLSEVPGLGFNDLDKQLRILEILTGVSEDHYYKLVLSELKKLIRMTDFVNHTPVDVGRVYKLKIKGRRFKINYDPKQLIAGEYVDISELTKTEEMIGKNLHKIISIYLKPVNVFGYPLRKCYEKNSNGELIQTLKSRKWTEERIQDSLTMDIVFPMSGFFLTLWQNLTEGIQTSLEKKMKKQMKSALNELDLTPLGVGSLQ
jgi:hypothetical protein